MDRIGPLIKRRGSGSLATRLAVRVLALAGVFALVTGAVAIAGVFQLMRGESDGRLRGYSDMLADDVGARLGTADRVLDSMALTFDVHAGDVVRRQQALDQFAGSNAEHFDLIAIVNANGRVVMTSYENRLPASRPGADDLLAADSGDATRYIWTRADGSPELWMVRPLPKDTEPGTLILARPHIGYLTVLVDSVRAVSADTYAVLLDTSGRLVASPTGVAQPALGQLEFTPANRPGTTGTVRLSQSGQPSMSGRYHNVEVPGVDLRVVAMAPDRGLMRASTGALVPAAVAVLLGGLGFALVASAFIRRLVSPLGEVESRALDITSGGYIRPISVERDDEIGRIADAFNVMAHRMNLLQDISQLLASSSEQEHVLDGIIQAMGHLLGTDQVALFLVDRDGQLEFARASGAPNKPEPVPPAEIGSESLVSRAFRAGMPLSFVGVEGSDEDETLSALFGPEIVCSGMAAPLIIGSESIGVVIAATPQSRVYTEAESELVRTLCAQAAVAVHNARLFEEEQRSREEAEALRHVAEALVNANDLGSALDEVAEITGALLETHCGGFAFSDRDMLGLEPAEDEELEHARLSILEMLVRDGEQSGAPSAPIVIDGSTLEDARARTFAEERGIEVMLVVPLIQEERTRGLLLLGCSSTSGFSERQIALADTIGKEVSLALTKAYLFEREKGRAASLERIFRISQAVSSSLQTNTVLNRVLDVVQKIFSADAVSLMRYEPSTRRIETSMARGIQSKELLFFSVEPGEDLPGEVFDSMRPRVHDDLEGVEGPLAELARAQGLRSLLVVPLVARGRSIGLLIVYAADPGVFSAEDLDLLMTFGSQAALAIDTADLYGREHRVASVLQASILPQQLPVIDGIDARSVYRPGSREAEIGGDYYDLFKVPDGRVMLVIGDVCGHGVRAATKTSMIKYLVRGLATAGLNPAEVLTQLNRMVCESGESSDIVTAWVGALDIGSGVLEYANGGHPPGLLALPGSSKAVQLGPTGALLGAVPWAEYGLERVELGAGAVILLYTDGVTEARRGKELFGEARLHDLVLHGGTASTVTQRVLAAVNEFVGQERLSDDVAVLTVRIVGEDDA